MLKTIILLITLITNIFATNEIEINHDSTYKNISIYPRAEISTIAENEQDWVGVYREGDSNNWDNVIS
ncbi:MAG TPA: hypothetical protein EYG75_03760 [Campylobacterales bacterium]|nr:hypothetical protein [Campylobacterales bacterium]